MIIPSSKNNKRGFTLLEVLVALAVLAIASGGILYTTSQNIQNASYLENRTLASWIAQNYMETLRLNAANGLQGGIESLTYANRDWTLNVQVSGPDLQNLYRVNIEVGLEKSSPSNRVFAELVGYIGKN